MFGLGKNKEFVLIKLTDGWWKKSEAEELPNGKWHAVVWRNLRESCLLLPGGKVDGGPLITCWEPLTDRMNEYFNQPNQEASSSEGDQP